jgi:hypothetical protein
LRNVRVPDIRRGNLVLGAAKFGVNDTVALGAVEQERLERTEQLVYALVPADPCAVVLKDLGKITHVDGRRFAGVTFLELQTGARGVGQTFGGVAVEEDQEQPTIVAACGSIDWVDPVPEKFVATVRIRNNLRTGWGRSEPLPRFQVSHWISLLIEQ